MSPRNYLPFSRIASRMSRIYDNEKNRWYIIPVGGSHPPYAFRAVRDGLLRLNRPFATVAVDRAVALRFWDFQKRDTAEFYVRNQIFRRVMIDTICFWRHVL